MIVQIIIYYRSALWHNKWHLKIRVHLQAARRESRGREGKEGGKIKSFSKVGEVPGQG